MPKYRKKASAKRSRRKGKTYESDIKDIITGLTFDYGGTQLRSDKLVETTARDFSDWIESETGQRPSAPFNENTPLGIELETAKDTLLLTVSLGADGNQTWTQRSVFTINTASSTQDRIYLQSYASVARMGDYQENGTYWTFPENVSIQKPSRLNNWFKAASSIPSSSYSETGYGKTILGEYLIEGGSIFSSYPNEDAKSIVAGFGGGKFFGEGWWRDPFAPNLI